MKKLKLFILMLSAGTVLFLSGCSKDKNTTPTITFIGGTGYTSVDGTVIAGTVLKVGINAAKGPDGSNLNEYKIERIYNNTPSTEFDSTSLNAANFTLTRYITTRSVAGTEKFTFEITDKDGNTAEVSFNITTTIPVTYGQINQWTNKTLGAQNAAAGSFFASSTGTIYTLTTLPADQTVIDVYYGVLATQGNESFISPSEIHTYGFDPTNLFTGTITHFDVSTISSATFDLLRNDSLIKDIPALTPLKVSIAQNGVYSFINAAGKKGVIKVTALTTGTSGSVTVNIKVQQ